SARPAGSAANPLAGKPLENHLEIFYLTESATTETYTKFRKLPAEAKAGMTTHETYYSSNDELLAKLHAGGTGYDIIVPSQNAVAELIQEKALMALDKALLPNLKNLDPSFLKPSYDPTGNYHVIKDFGITMFFYNNKIITEQPQTMLDFYHLLNKYAPKGRTNLLDGAEEVVPLAAHAWINWLLTPSTAVTEMNYHNYPIPIPAALDQLSASLRDDPKFNVPAKYTDNYHYILNVSPQVVQARTQIYSEFKAA